MAHVTSFWTRLTRSARGELFNPLTYPFLLSTLVYGLGFTVFAGTEAAQKSSLFIAMHTIAPAVAYTWGALAVLVIVVGVYSLVFDKPPIGKANALVGFMLWAFAAWNYVLTGSWIVLLSVAGPHVFFWGWQYVSLGKFRRQDVLDNQTMERYDRGQYDDEENPKDSRKDRRDNRGVSELDRDIRS